MMVQLRVVFLILIQCTVIFNYGKKKQVLFPEGRVHKNETCECISSAFTAMFYFRYFYATGENEICYIT